MTAYRTRAGGLMLLAGGLVTAGFGWPWLAVALLLVGFLTATRRLTGWAYASLGVVTTAGLLLAAVRGGVGSDELGVAPASLPAGLGWALLTGALTGVAVLLAARLPRLTGLFGSGAGSVTRAVLLDIPFGTVLVEEVAFRAVLPALLSPALGTPAAVVVASLLFGLWHVPGVLEQGGRAREVTTVIAVTATGGVLLCLLRYASGSLLVPVALHWALNGIGLYAGARRARAASHRGA